MPPSNNKAASSARASKPKPSKSVTLKIPSGRLMKWVEQGDAVKPSAPPSKGASAGSTPPATSKNSPTEAKAEPSGANTPEVPGKDGKKNGHGAKGGAKRGAAALDDGKARAKPGPKRRKLYATSPVSCTRTNGHRDGPLDENHRPWTTPAAPVGHKVGPKANQGAINACLRALDLRGPPCRRWTRKPFAVKSFTGTVWELPTWATPKRPDDNKGDSTPTSNGEHPAAPGSGVGSDAPADPGATASSPPVVSTPA